VKRWPERIADEFRPERHSESGLASLQVLAHEPQEGVEGDFFLHEALYALEVLGHLSCIVHLAEASRNALFLGLRCC